MDHWVCLLEHCVLGILTNNDTVLSGQLTLKVPPFVNIDHDEALRKATVSIQDAEIAHQRAMWGMFFSLLFCMMPCRWF